jgi:hypothetical protein
MRMQMRMQMRREDLRRAGWAATAALAAALALASCRPSAEAVADGDDPLAALAQPAQSARYDGPFWTREAHRGSRLWQAARAFCDQARERQLLNCHPVELVERWEGPLRAGATAPPALPALPALAPPPPLPPALHPGESGGPGADFAALKAWEARLAERGRGAASRGPRGQR